MWKVSESGDDFILLAAYHTHRQYSEYTTIRYRQDESGGGGMIYILQWLHFPSAYQSYNCRQMKRLIILGGNLWKNNYCKDINLLLPLDYMHTDRLSELLQALCILVLCYCVDYCNTIALISPNRCSDKKARKSWINCW